MANKKILDRFTDIQLLDEYKGRSAKYLARVRYDLRRVELGFCMFAGCKENRIGRYCRKHQDYYNGIRRAWYERTKTKPKPHADQNSVV